MSERIKLLREFLGMSKAEFARNLGITGNSIGDMEAGRSKPSNSTIKLMSVMFKVREEWIRTGEGEMTLPMSGRDWAMAEIMREFETLSEEDQVFFLKELKDLYAHFGLNKDKKKGK
jgi:transcriptional regulator with XRE-family HTH domain